jgi:hypothetical protein
LGFGVLGGNEQIIVTEYPTSRLIKQEVAQDLILCNPARLLPNCFPRWWGNTADNYVPDFTFRMTTDNVDNFAGSHKRMFL